MAITGAPLHPRKGAKPVVSMDGGCFTSKTRSHTCSADTCGRVYLRAAALRIGDLGAGGEVLLRGSAGDQARQVVELLRILVDELERQLQPVTFRLGLQGGDGVQVAI